MFAFLTVMYIKYTIENCKRPEVHTPAAWGRDYKVGRTQIPHMNFRM